MNKYFFGFFLLFLPFCLSANTFILPDRIMVSADNPGLLFPEIIQKHFEITGDSPSKECLKQQEYLVTMLIYRNAVDHKMVAVYRPANDQHSCWVNLISYSDQLLPELADSGWSPPSPGANTWCKSEARFCPILTVDHKVST